MSAFIGEIRGWRLPGMDRRRIVIRYVQFAASLFQSFPPYATLSIRPFSSFPPTTLFFIFRASNIIMYTYRFIPKLISPVVVGLIKAQIRYLFTYYTLSRILVLYVTYRLDVCDLLLISISPVRCSVEIKERE